jgi:hypothetical protein
MQACRPPTSTTFAANLLEFASNFLGSHLLPSPPQAKPIEANWQTVAALLMAIVGCAGLPDGKVILTRPCIF